MKLRLPGSATTYSLALLLCTAAPMVANAAASATAGGLPFEIKAVGIFKDPYAMAFLPDGNMLVT